ncbi:MAG: transposase [Flavobacteriales bacterium]|nr:transposase [Flavobacteriales bacterium]
MDTENLFFNEHEELEITRRNRPHWKQEGKVHFVTWRLADSLPQVKLRELERDRKAWRARHGDKDVRTLDPSQRREYYRLFHERVERWLDAGAGSCVLRQPIPREEMIVALHYFDGPRYRLGTFAVAGNHVHVLVVPLVGVDLSTITHTWKSYTAKSINKVLGRTGTLWKAESFDHIVRSEASLVKFERYIRAHEAQGAYVEEHVLV